MHCVTEDKVLINAQKSNQKKKAFKYIIHECDMQEEISSKESLEGKQEKFTVNSNNDKFRVKNKISKKNGERPNTENT